MNYFSPCYQQAPGADVIALYELKIRMLENALRLAELELRAKDMEIKRKDSETAAANIKALKLQMELADADGEQLARISEN